VTHARTHACAVLAAAMVVHAFSSRNRTRSVFSSGPFSNPWLLGAAALSGLLLAAVVQLPLLGQIFVIEPLARAEWLRVAALALTPLPIIEILKAFLRSRAGD
jgi:P-type Ca2+ transporter type 2C